MNYPADQMEFEEMFNTEQDCIDYLVLARWPHGFECPVCGSIRPWKKIKGRFEGIDCHTETTVINRTIFHKSTKPLLIWFRAIWWMVAQKNGVSAKGLQKILGLGSYQTAWTWLHKFRRLMVLSGRNKLQGIIEVDEVLVGGKASGKRGRGAEGKKQGNAGPYINTQGRNDIIEERVAYDKNYFTLYVETAKPISSYKDSNWMMLLIDSDLDPTTGWYGYDLLINGGTRNADSTEVKIYKNGTWKSVDKINYQVKGNKLMFSLSKNLFPSSKGFDFHWVDNPKKLKSISDLFFAGENAPSRRANYRFLE